MGFPNSLDFLAGVSSAVQRGTAALALVAAAVQMERELCPQWQALCPKWKMAVELYISFEY